MHLVTKRRKIQKRKGNRGTQKQPMNEKKEKTIAKKETKHEQE